MSLLKQIKKEENDISEDVNFLQNIVDGTCIGFEDVEYLESKEKLEEIHSCAWNILLKVERMLRFNEGTVIIKE